MRVIFLSLFLPNIMNLMTNFMIIFLIQENGLFVTLMQLLKFFQVMMILQVGILMF